MVDRNNDQYFFISIVCIKQITLKWLTSIPYFSVIDSSEVIMDLDDENTENDENAEEQAQGLGVNGMT